MYLINLSPEISNMMGYAAGLVLSYFLNRNYAFNSVAKISTEVVRFTLSFLVAYALNFAVLVILIHKINMHEGISQIYAGLVYVAASYLISRYYVFKPIESR